MIKLSSVNKHYVIEKKEFKILKDINLDVSSGDFIAIMGSSGSGKTTLMNIIGCLDRSDSGEVYINNHKISIKNEHDLACIRNQQLGFVFQNFHLISRYNAITNVELPLMYAGMEKNKRVARAREALDKVELSSRMFHHPNQLSGGQKQRVAIARAIVNQPNLILADEPTGSLDLNSSRKIMGILKNLQLEGTTIVLVTHEIEIAKYADRIFHLNNTGRLELLMEEG